MSLEFHNGAWRQVCPGCHRRGCACEWRKGALYLTCEGCDSVFCMRPDIQSHDWSVWVRRLADPDSIHHCLRLGIPDDQMPLIEVCKQAEGKQAKASIDVRKFDQTGRIFFDLYGLEVVK